MIEKIRQLLANGQQMTFASRAGVRTINISDKIQDPLNEIQTYHLDTSFDGRVVLRFYSNGQPVGYVFYKNNGKWNGNHSGSWTELTAVDTAIWSNLRNYSPPVKKVEPIKEHIRSVLDTKGHEVTYDWEPSSEEAIVIWVTEPNTKVLSILEKLKTTRDIIVEVDMYPTMSRVDVIRKIKEAAPYVKLIEHTYEFGYGNIVVNSHRNVFSKYEKALFIDSRLIITDHIDNVAFSLSNSTGSVFSQVGRVVGGNGVDPYTFGEISGPLLAYVMLKEDWLAVEPEVTKYQKTFLITKYKERPHQSIVKWLLDEYHIRCESSEPLEVMFEFARKIEKPIRYGLLEARAAVNGELFSDERDAKRRKFTKEVS